MHNLGIQKKQLGIELVHCWSTQSSGFYNYL